MTTEAETGVLNAQVKGSWQPQEIGRVKERTSSPREPLEVGWSSQHLDFRLLASRTVRK